MSQGEARLILESEWVEASRAGDREAFGRLVEGYQTEVFNLARRMLDDREAARDVAQEAFLRAYVNLARFRPGEPFRPWLMRIAANLAMDRLRQSRRTPLPLLETVPDGGPERDPETAALAHAEQAALRRAIRSLPEEYRTLIVLAHLQELSHEEIMAITGLTLTLVKNRLYRARLMLKDALGGARR